MFDVSSVSGGNTGSNYTPLVSNNEVLGRDDFLMLLICELQNQNPLEPIKNEDYVAQLTQFTSLDELRNISELLQAQLAGDITNLNAQALSMIGREVTVQTESIEHTTGQEHTITFDVPAREEVKITIYNSRGQVVREDTVVGKAGWETYTFDGRNNNGNSLTDGTYTVRITSVTDGSQAAAEYEVFQVGRVIGVDFSGTVAVLELDNGQKVPLTNVIAVRQPELQAKAA